MISLPKMRGASVHAQWVTCGRPGCRCASGSLHGPYHYLFWREGGRLKKRYIPKADMAAVMAACEELREARSMVQTTMSVLRDYRRQLKEVTSND